MSVKDLPDEPREPGAVIRVHNPDGKYPEHWIASYINGGAWYPDQETYLTGVGVKAFVKEHNHYPHYWDVAKRGRVELLTVGDKGAYREGWRAGVRAVAQACDELEADFPDYPGAEAMAAIAAACTCANCMTGGRCVEDQPEDSSDDEDECEECTSDCLACSETADCDCPTHGGER